VISLDGAGNFTITEYSVNGAAGSQSFSGNGTYAENANCSLNLTFATPVSGTSGAITPPASFSVLLGLTTTSSTGASTYTGLITVQPTTGVVLPGTVISQ
jgi:hypothetical protein